MDKLDLDLLGADAAYTLDDEHPGELNWETFSGGGAVLTIEGVSTHPGEGRTYKMVDALMLAGRLPASLPVEHAAPETTDERDGYIHAAQITGNVANAEVRFILRDRNMGCWLSEDMLPVDLADRAMWALGLTPSHPPTRGGTDGSRPAACPRPACLRARTTRTARTSTPWCRKWNSR